MTELEVTLKQSSKYLLLFLPVDRYTLICKLACLSAPPWSFQWLDECFCPLSLSFCPLIMLNILSKRFLPSVWVIRNTWKKVIYVYVSLNGNNTFRFLGNILGKKVLLKQFSRYFQINCTLRNHKHILDSKFWDFTKRLASFSFRIRESI